MKYLLTFLITFCLIGTTFSKPIQRVWQQGCNGDFGSNIHDFPDKTVIICWCVPEAEATGCPSSGLVWGGDVYDTQAADELFTYVEVQTSTGTSNGSHSISYLVPGEISPRIYVVVWNTDMLTNEVTATVDKLNVVAPF